jgi:hypothetical protein
MTSLVFQRLTSSLLYVAQDGNHGSLAFLLWSAARAPQTLTFDQIWADSGAPQFPGYFLILNAPAVTELEPVLRAAMPAPTATGIAWASFTPGSPAPATVALLLRIRLGARGMPRVEGDTPVYLPAGMMMVSFKGKSPVAAVRDGGSVTALAISYPALAGAPKPLGPALRIELAGPDTGCLRFDGLVGAPDSQAALPLMQVRIDPLAPFDPSRTFETYTGRSYAIRRNKAGWHLAPGDRSP